MPSGYELLDAGDGRRLERFGERVVDRPAPAAQAPRRDPGAWPHADLRFERDRGWTGSRGPWHVDVDGLTLELRPTETGQVGLFPEHLALWNRVRGAADASVTTPVLNLFAYTGATTLALAREGAPVAHVDAARTAVAWARRNAELSGLADRPVRWIVDDAATFAGREVRRGRRYGGVVLDPPAYGHGAGRAWRLEADLGGLLADCGRLLDPGGWLVVTVHSTGWDAERLDDAVRALPDVTVVERGSLTIEARSGTVLALGSVVRGMIAR